MGSPHLWSLKVTLTLDLTQATPNKFFIGLMTLKARWEASGWLPCVNCLLPSRMDRLLACSKPNITLCHPTPPTPSGMHSLFSHFPSSWVEIDRYLPDLLECISNNKYPDCVLWTGDHWDMPLICFSSVFLTHLLPSSSNKILEKRWRWIKAMLGIINASADLYESQFFLCFHYTDLLRELSDPPRYAF